MIEFLQAFYGLQPNNRIHPDARKSSARR
jgi:hypothetical protein